MNANRGCRARFCPFFTDAGFTLAASAARFRWSASPSPLELDDAPASPDLAGAGTSSGRATSAGGATASGRSSTGSSPAPAARPPGQPSSAKTDEYSAKASAPANGQSPPTPSGLSPPVAPAMGSPDLIRSEPPFSLRSRASSCDGAATHCHWVAS
uniref:Uncharacterized protein n=1 Tax=Arundo donax TaxID=35708 RepID=A0A0A9CFY8_ARUDO